MLYGTVFLFNVWFVIFLILQGIMKSLPSTIRVKWTNY